MQIIDIPNNPDTQRQMAQMLVDGFREHWNAWETTDEGLEEIQTVLKNGFARVALDDDGRES
jgi:hypothetical protein